jgi:ABC-type ATPase with predicted acetyltransferase domain
MKKCVTGKRLYATSDLAEEALIEARTQYDYSGNMGPVAIYLCEDCGFYHLTSRGPMNARLAKQLADGTINRQKEANRWLDKFKKK